MQSLHGINHDRILAVQAISLTTVALCGIFVDRHTRWAMKHSLGVVRSKYVIEPKWVFYKLLSCVRHAGRYVNTASILNIYSLFYGQKCLYNRNT